MTPSEKQKEIAVAFSVYFVNKTQMNFPTEANASEIYDSWLLTEEGKRLTAEEPGQEEELKWLRATVEEQYEAWEALAKETAADIKALKAQFDRFEGGCTVTVSELNHRVTNRNE